MQPNAEAGERINCRADIEGVGAETIEFGDNKHVIRFVLVRQGRNKRPVHCRSPAGNCLSDDAAGLDRKAGALDLHHLVIGRLVDGRWSMVDGRWSMVDGRWSMVDGRGKGMDEYARHGITRPKGMADIPLCAKPPQAYVLAMAKSPDRKRSIVRRSRHTVGYDLKGARGSPVSQLMLRVVSHVRQIRATAKCPVVPRMA